MDGVPPACRIAKATGANLLLIGARTLTEPIIGALWPGVDLPIWRPGRHFLLPVEAETLVLYDVDSLWHAEQLHLARWLESRTRPTQVVSTSLELLTARVASDALFAMLYYRLNTFCIDLRADVGVERTKTARSR